MADQFANCRYVKSAEQARQWLMAIIAAQKDAGDDDELRYPEDCSAIVAELGRVGIAISPEDAQSFWEAVSNSVHAGWLTFGDAIGHLDCLVSDIKENNGNGGVPWLVKTLRDWHPSGSST